MNLFFFQQEPVLGPNITVHKNIELGPIESVKNGSVTREVLLLPKRSGRRCSMAVPTINSSRHVDNGPGAVRRNEPFEHYRTYVKGKKVKRCLDTLSGGGTLDTTSQALFGAVRSIGPLSFPSTWRHSNGNDRFNSPILNQAYKRAKCIQEKPNLRYLLDTHRTQIHKVFKVQMGAASSN